MAFIDTLKKVAGYVIPTSGSPNADLEKLAVYSYNLDGTPVTPFQRKRVNCNAFSLWTVTGNVVGSGVVSNRADFLRQQTGTTASSTVVSYTSIPGLLVGNATYGLVDWSKELWIFFGLRRITSEAQTIARIQIKQIETIGNLAALGLGIYIANLTLSGESYGTQRNTTSLGTTLVSSQSYQIAIHLQPSVPQIDWYVDGVLKGSETVAANIPTVAATAPDNFVVSVENGVTGGTNAELFLLPNIDIVQLFA